MLSERIQRILSLPSFSRFNNHGNVISIQNISDEDISAMERTVKDELDSWLVENTIDKNLTEYFGEIYASKPDKFKFFSGNIKMIKRLSSHVEKTVAKEGYDYFKGIFTSGADTQCRRASFESEVDKKEDLFNKISDCLQPYGSDVVSRLTKEKIILKNENGSLRGAVHCVLCESEDKNVNKRKRKRANHSYALYWNGHGWSISNYSSHHLLSFHPIPDPANEQKRFSQANSTSNDADFEMKDSKI